MPLARKFSDIFGDTVQLLWLKRFLSDHGAITPLKFWQDVERMKTQSKDSRARQTKARVIVKQYFANTDDPSKLIDQGTFAQGQGKFRRFGVDDRSVAARAFFTQLKVYQLYYIV